MNISPALIDEIVAHALEDPANEVCGVVAVAEDHTAAARRVLRATNVHASPMKFEIDPQELLGLYSTIEGEGNALGAIYHSHVRSPPYPSQTDVNFAANWPGVEWIIVGLAAGSEPEVRSYLIEDGRINEVAIAERGGVSDRPLVCPDCGRTYSRSERFCEDCAMPLVHVPGAERDASERQRQARKIKPQYSEGRLVKVARAENQPEAELIAALLLEEGIPSMQKRSGGFDVPDFLAAGPRDILVPESGAEAAREALAPPAE